MRSTKESITTIILSILYDYLLEFIGSVIVLVLPIIYHYLGNSKYSIKMDVRIIYVVILIVTIVSVFLSIYIKRNLRKVSAFFGRDDSMEANTRIISAKMKKNTHISSTRITFWPHNESSTNRMDFRRALNEKIDSGYYVRRIWQINADNDIDKLELFLKMHENRDNYSVKCFCGNNFSIPEILITDKIACVSIPQPENPRELTNTYHFKNKKDIRSWQNYFEVLWNSSIPIKEGEKIYKDNISQIRKEVSNLTTT